MNQVNAMYDVTDSILAKHVAMVSDLKGHFESFQLTKVPRVKNGQANLLSKLGSNNSCETRSVYIDVLSKPSFQKSRFIEINTNPKTPS